MTPPSAQYNISDITVMFSDPITEVFGSDVEFSFASGSVAYGGGLLGKSDIDIAVVLKNKHSLLTQEERNAAAIAFARVYIDIHRRTGFIPDTLFPGEILTEGLCDDAINGRGFSYKDGLIYLPPASNNYYCQSPEHWFRAWLSMTAFSVFVNGNEDTWRKKKQLAWESILKYIFLRGTADPTPLSVIQSLTSEENKWLGFGITANYHAFGDREIHFIQLGIEGLHRGGFLTSRVSGLEPHPQALLDWAKRTAAALESGEIQKHNLFLTMSDQYLISEAVKDV